MPRFPLPEDIHSGRIYVGTVVDNTSSDNKFIRVRIPGIDQSIADEDLPWSGIGRPLFRGGGDNTGIWSIPRVGTKVAGFFDAGDRDSYVIFMEIESPSTTVGWENDEWGFQDEEGTHIKIKVGETLHIEHKSTTINIDSSGNIQIRSSDGNAEYEANQHTFKGPVNFEDPVTMDQTLVVEQEATISNIPFTTHRHGGVQTGGGTTGIPQ